MITDPIANMLTVLRNSIKARHATCEIPASKINENILKILKATGYISNYVRTEQKPQDILVVTHKYIGKQRQPVVNTIKRISKPGCRIYCGYEELKPVLGGLGYYILSTPKGVITDADARAGKVGGEVICQIW